MSGLGILAVAFAAYLVGSLPTGFLWAKARGIDIRAHGSGNIGATNAFRVLGKPAGVAVLLIDALKGALAVLVLPRLFQTWFPGADPAHLKLTAGLAAVLGHNYTCWLGFKGGKGIATSAGVLAALVPTAFLITLVVFLVVFGVSRFVSLASVLAALALPIATAVVQTSRPILGLTILLAALAIWKHRPNLKRLLAGTEPRFGAQPSPPAPVKTPPSTPAKQ